MSPGQVPDIHFPDVAKLELDELIDQLVVRAHAVKQAQGRLRALLRAIETISGNLSLDAVLRNVVESACELASARYAALGVIGFDGGLEQFIHTGFDESTVRAIGQLPEGKGLLGALITDPRPIRLKHMGEDPRAAGFPPHHPPMDSFLGVPIRIHGEVFGNLYLADSIRGEFTDEDEELVKALGAAAGTAITNARLYHESRLQQRWLTASVEIGSQLLASTGEDPLKTIARRAFELADADLVSVGLLSADRQDVVVEIAIGDATEELVGARFPLTETLVRRVVGERAPLLLSAEDADTTRSILAAVLDVGPLMVLPLAGTDDVRGVLSIARLRGQRGFDTSDLNMAAGFASHASVALELADARSAEQRLLLLEDRERIARDLHDHVIQELFAIGLSLESTSMLLGTEHPAAQRMQERVADIDRTIRQIRTSIFQLRGAIGGSVPDGLRQRVLDIAGELTPALGFAPRVSFTGLVDIVLTSDVADDVLAVVREGLANVAKHADATKAEVDLEIVNGEATVTVSDNGRGLGAPSRSSGLHNLRARAERRGGSFETRPSSTGGTTLLWKTPIG